MLLIKMKSIGKVDSMNFGSNDLEYLFKNDNFVIEDIKTIGSFYPKRWVQEFGKPLTRNILEAKIIHTITGLSIPLKRYSSNKKIQVIEFAGLQGYNERSILLDKLLEELLPKLQECYIKRIDICFDFVKVPNNIIKSLCIKRNHFKYKNTIYYKTDNELKTNSTVDIKRYNKQLQAKLNYPLERLEFAFKGRYFNDIRLQDLNSKVYEKMRKTIKNFTNKNLQISPISYKCIEKSNKYHFKHYEQRAISDY